MYICIIYLPSISITPYGLNIPVLKVMEQYMFARIKTAAMIIVI